MAQSGVLIEGVEYSRSGGTYTFEAEWRGREVEIEYQVLLSETEQTALGQLGLNLATGTLGQPAWSHLASNHSAQAIGYSGLANLYAAAYDLGESADLANHNFEASTPSEYSATVLDAEMSRVVSEFLTDGVRGVQWPASKLGDLTHFKNYCISHGLFMSPELLQQRSAAETLRGWLSLTNSDVVWSGTQLKVVPLGDEARTANGATYTPNNTPVYDLKVGDFLHTAGQPRVKLAPRPNEDAFNIIRVEFKNRENDYALEIAEARDVAHIELYGERTASVMQAHEIKVPSVAAFVAQMLLQRQMAVWNDYTFLLPWTYSLLEPLDLLTLTEPDQYLDRQPVRITKIVEHDDDAWEITAEDAPIGLASAPIYGAQAGEGYKPDFNVAPGNVDAPIIFELPPQLATETGLQLAVAVRGVGPDWGGCQVWVSMDGSNYRAMGAVHGGARYGTLASSFSSTVGVQGLGNEQLLSGSVADAQGLQTLCYVAGATPEYWAYQTATLTGPGAYTLSGLVRGAYGTPAVTHSAGEGWVRVDERVLRSEALQPSMVGSTVYFKFTSFNAFGAAQQSLADVSPVAYTINGGMLALRERTGNLLDASQWVVGTSGTQGARPFRFLCNGPESENKILLVPGPSGQLQPMWYCESLDDGAAADGGWNTERFGIDHLQTYHVGVWVYCFGTMDGAAYLGIGADSVRDIGGGINSNPYHVVAGRTALQAGRFYYLAGRILPSTYDGPHEHNSGIWDGTTGQKIADGNDFRWVDGQTTTTQRAYMYYAGVGAKQYLSAPDFYPCDGTEPTIQQILASAALGRANEANAAAADAQADADAANARVAAMEADGVLTPLEKAGLIADYNVILGEQAGIDARATAYGITTEKTAYDAAITALTTYLDTLTTPTTWNSLAGDTNITGTTLRGKFTDVGTTKQALLNAIAAVAGTQATWALLAGRPGDTDLLNTHSQGGVLVVNHPAGGNSGFNGGAYTGALKIKLPQSWSNTMLRFFVEIYEYAGDNGCTLEVGGYTFSGAPSWYNVYAKSTGSAAAEKAVRFGHDGSTCCIWIGEPTSTWSYPQVVVSNVRAGYSNNAAALWGSGWALSIDNTAHSGHSITGTITNPLTGASLPASSGTVGTAQAAPGAFARVYHVDVSAAQTLTAALDAGNAQFDIPAPGFNCAITITATMNLKATGGTSHGCSAVGVIRVADSGTNANRDAGPDMRGPIAAVSTTISAALTVTRTIAYTVGQGARTVWLDCRRLGVTPSGGAWAEVSDIHMRVEVVLR